jgi:aspartate aminotransferase
MRLSDSASRLDGQEMFQILAKTKELEAKGQDIIHFELGDPDFDTPQNITDSIMKSISSGETHYAPSTGIKDLKEAIINSTHVTKHFTPNIDQLLVTAGANIQLYYAIACLVNPGDEVIVPDPGFVSYYSILKFLGIRAVRVRLKEENEFRLNPLDVAKAITKKTRMIIINSPSNPTGSVMTQKEIKDIYDIAEHHDLMILSDEVYGKIRFDGVEQHSPSKYDHCKDRVIIINSFSKSYAMPGFRLGVCIGPSKVINKMGLMLETTSSCVSPFIQRAGIEAVNGSQSSIDYMVSVLDTRRRILVEELNKLKDVSCLLPKGAFYVFPNIRHTGLTCGEFTDLMLKFGVSVAPGDIFGNYGEGHIRMSYTNSIKNIIKAVARMEKALESI